MINELDIIMFIIIASFIVRWIMYTYILIRIIEIIA
jgi:hypothetical protein